MGRIRIDPNAEHFDIPNHFTYICSGAFEDCVKLKSVTIPDSVTSIGINAFKGCRSLEEIVFPPNLEHIGMMAFSDCTSLRSVSIPDSVSTIGMDAFSHCTSLSEITLPKNLSNIASSTFFACSSLKVVSIPGSVTKIGNKAFCGCDALVSIEIPDSVTKIGEGAFSYCKRLKYVVFPERLKTIASSAFYCCPRLLSASLPDSVSSIGCKAFEGCTSLSEIALPPNFSCIAKNTFSGCSSLKTVSIPNSVTSIGEGAFSGCKALESVEISDSVTHIAKNAFESCSNLKRVAIPRSVQFIGTNAFNGTDIAHTEDGFAVLDDCLVGYEKSDEKVIRIPEGIRLIGSVVFPENVEEIYIPATVKYTSYLSFEKTKWYDYFPEKYKFFVIGDNTLMKYFGHEKNVVIPDGVKRVAMAAFSGKYSHIFVPHLYDRLEIPRSVCEMDAFALSGAEFKTISLFGMEFSCEELHSQREHFCKGLRDIPYAVKLARDFRPSLKINKRLEVAAALTYYFDHEDKSDDRAEKYLKKRLFLAAELLIDKDKPELLIRLIDSKDFSINERRLNSLIGMAERKNRSETAELLRRYKDRR